MLEDNRELLDLCEEELKKLSLEDFVISKKIDSVFTKKKKTSAEPLIKSKKKAPEKR